MNFRFYERIYISRMLGMGITMLKRFNAVKIYFVKFHFYEHRKVVNVKILPLFNELMRLIYAKKNLKKIWCIWFKWDNFLL